MLPIITVVDVEGTSASRFFRHLDTIIHEMGQHICRKEMSKQRPTTEKKMIRIVANIPIFILALSNKVLIIIRMITRKKEVCAAKRKECKEALWQWRGDSNEQSMNLGI